MKTSWAGIVLSQYIQVVSLVLFGGCRHVENPDAAVKSSETAASKSGKYQFCAALRGNGELIYAHFNSLARITEHYGPVDAIAGGSSGSITSFLYESMLQNPLLNRCAENQPCELKDKAYRLSFMLKSVREYASFLGETDEAIAIMGLYDFSKKVQASGVAALLNAGRFAEAQAKLRVLLESKDLAGILNRDALRMLEDPAHTKLLYDAIVSFGKYEATSQVIFFRPGFIDFRAFASMVGRIGNFYAGRFDFYDRKAFGGLLDQCASLGAGKSWGAIKDLAINVEGRNSSCGKEFDDILRRYRKELIAQEKTLPSRVDEPIGGFLPAIISTSVFFGEANISLYKEAEKAFWANQPYNMKFANGFRDVNYGYWGSSSDLSALLKNRMGYDDLKTKKFYSLLGGRASAPWREALATSPAEPGLAAIQPISDKVYSIGGWSDLHPVLVLKNIGCENVVYVTRTGEESDFMKSVGKLLGITQSEENSLYAFNQTPLSSYELSVKNSTAVWCTNWNEFKGTDVEKIEQDTFNGTMVTRAPFFTMGHDGLKPYEAIASSSSKLGCVNGNSL